MHGNMRVLTVEQCEQVSGGSGGLGTMGSGNCTESGTAPPTGDSTTNTSPGGTSLVGGSGMGSGN